MENLLRQRHDDIHKSPAAYSRRHSNDEYDDFSFRAECLSIKLLLVL